MFEELRGLVQSNPTQSTKNVTLVRVCVFVCVCVCMCVCVCVFPVAFRTYSFYKPIRGARSPSEYLNTFYVLLTGRP